MALTGSTLGSREPDARGRRQLVDDGRACGRLFQDAAILVLDPEEPDEPDPVEPDADDPDDDVLDPEEPVDEPEPADSEEDDDAFCSLLPLSLPAGAFGFSRLSVR
ncbi:MAG: hypothetical protein ACJ73E_09965 [Mycobacteriales bacterium]